MYEPLEPLILELAGIPVLRNGDISNLIVCTELFTLK